MRMGSNSGFKRSLVFFLFIFITINTIMMSFQSYAIAPLLAPAASTVLRLFTATLVKRVVQTAANDAVFTVLKTGTQRGITSALSSMSSRLGAGTVYKTSTGALTWLGAGLLLTPNDIAVNNFSGGNVIVATSGVDMGNGKYKIEHNGEVYYSDFMPTTENPFIAVKTNNVTAAETVTTLQTYHQYSTYNPIEPKKFLVGSPYSIAFTFVSLLAENKRLSCGGAQLKTCQYGSITVTLKPAKNGSKKDYLFDYSYTYHDVDNRGEQRENTVPLQRGVVINYNDKYIHTEGQSNESNYVIPSEKTGFIELDDLKDKPVEINALAAMMNALMMEAASQENYEGIPFNSTNPITQEELNQVIRENNLNLSQHDLLYPMASATNGFQFPNYSPSSSSNSSTSTNKEPDYQHPTVSEPVLEDIPTAEMILNPLKQFFPFLIHLDLGTRDVSCPIVQFDAFNTTVVIDSHCPLIEQNRTLFYTISLIIWSFLALRVVLTA